MGDVWNVVSLIVVGFFALMQRRDSFRHDTALRDLKNQNTGQAEQIATLTEKGKRCEEEHKSKDDDLKKCNEKHAESDKERAELKGRVSVLETMLAPKPTGDK